MYPLLKRLAPLKAGTFIDIGANLGQTLIALKRADPNRRYIGFEPNPVCVRYVGDLIKANSYTSSVAVPVALFDRDSLLALDHYSLDDADSSASLVPRFRPDMPVVRTQYVPALTFETISRSVSVGNVGIVKIDVEGAELDVLTTLTTVIAQFRPFIILEILPVYTKQNEERLKRQEKIETLVSALSYEWRRIVRNERDQYIGLQAISTVGIHSDMRGCDYVLIPSELSDTVPAMDGTQLKNSD